jgi:hypothetical protein
MTDDFKFTKNISVAIKDLADLATQENVPDPGGGYRGFYGLPQEFPHILFVLDRMEVRGYRLPLVERAAVLDKPNFDVTNRHPARPKSSPASAKQDIPAQIAVETTLADQVLQFVAEPMACAITCALAV